MIYISVSVANHFRVFVFVFVFYVRTRKYISTCILFSTGESNRHSIRGTQNSKLKTRSQTQGWMRCMRVARHLLAWYDC